MLEILMAKLNRTSFEIYFQKKEITAHTTAGQRKQKYAIHTIYNTFENENHE